MNVSLCGLFIYVSPVIYCRPVQGVPFLLPYVSRDRSKPPETLYRISNHRWWVEIRFWSLSKHDADLAYCQFHELKYKLAMAPRRTESWAHYSTPSITTTPPDGTTLVGLVSVGDELAYRDDVEWLVRWCKDNNKLVLNTTKTNNETDIYQCSDWGLPDLE